MTRTLLRFPVIIPLGAVLVAVLLGMPLVAWAGENPLAVLGTVLRSSLLEASGWRETLGLATPLAIIGVGLAFGFRAGVWNIGAEGQFVVGAAASIAVVGYISSWPGFVLIPLGLIAGALGGATWGAVAGGIHVRFGANEVIVSLLLVYVAESLVNWIVRIPLKDPASFQPESRHVGNAALPDLPGTQVHIGVLLVVVLVPLAWLVLRTTRFGFLVRAHGGNRYAVGANETRPTRLPFWLLVLGGGLAGMAGFVQLAGSQYRLQAGAGTGFGFTAIIVALLGRNHPVGVAFAAVGLSAMLVGAEAAQRDYELPVTLIQTVQALVVVLLVAGEATQALLERRARTARGPQPPAHAYAAEVSA